MSVFGMLSSIFAKWKERFDGVAMEQILKSQTKLALREGGEP